MKGICDLRFFTMGKPATICAIIFLTGPWLLAVLPELPKPKDAVTQEIRDEDVKAFRNWRYSLAKPPDVEAMARLAAWTKEHQEDGEALFYLWAGYRFNVPFDVIAPADIKPEELALLLRRASELGFLPARARYASALLDPTLDNLAAPSEPEAGRKILDECIGKESSDAYVCKGRLLLYGSGETKPNPAEAERVVLREVGQTFTLPETSWPEKLP